MNVRAEMPLLTADEFDELADTRGLELVDGVVKEKSVGGESSWVNSRVNRVIRAWAEDADVGHVFDAEGSYQCFPRGARTVRKPDVSFVRRGRFRGEVIPKGHIPIPPDLAVEVVSPNDRVDELEDKLKDYRAAGVPLVWVIYPEQRIARVHRPDRTITEVAEDGRLEAEDVLPGFRVRVGDLFPPAPPPSPDQAPEPPAE